MLHPRVSRAGVRLVMRLEGLRSRADPLAGGGFVVGYGHTLSAREGVVVSEADAEALLYYDLSVAAGRVEAWTFAPLTTPEFEALTAFAFAIGVENFRRSTVLKRVNEGRMLAAASAMELWRRAEIDGERLVVDALVRRRAAEKAHFLSLPGAARPSPGAPLRPLYDEAAARAPLSTPADRPDPSAPSRDDGVLAMRAALASPPAIDRAPRKARVRLAAAVGLLGVAMFAAAVFSMFHGRADSGNLAAGLAGIAFMAPAAYVLGRRPDDRRAPPAL